MWTAFKIVHFCPMLCAKSKWPRQANLCMRGKQRNKTTILRFACNLIIIRASDAVRPIFDIPWGKGSFWGHKGTPYINLGPLKILLNPLMYQNRVHRVTSPYNKDFPCKECDWHS